MSTHDHLLLLQLLRYLSTYMHHSCTANNVNRNNEIMKTSPQKILLKLMTYSATELRLVGNKNFVITKLTFSTSRWVFTARLCPQFGIPPSFDRSTTPRHRFNYNIPARVVLLQQCHCRNHHKGKLQNVSLRQFRLN